MTNGPLTDGRGNKRQNGGKKARKSLVQCIGTTRRSGGKGRGGRLVITAAASSVSTLAGVKEQERERNR